jgi:hypothetical protein
MPNRKFMYGSRARPLSFIDMQGIITSNVIGKELHRKSQGIDYSYEKHPYFNILLTKKPLTQSEIKSLELTPLRKKR